MIVVRGHTYDLPEQLGTCPREHAVLVWDGRWAWRCAYERITGSHSFQEAHRCGYGITIAGLFDDSDLEMKLAAGVPLQDLSLTSYGLGLVAAKQIYFDWLTPYQATLRQLDLPDEEATDQGFKELRNLMRIGPRVGIGQRIG
jgi:hypothetical protein